MRPFSPKVANWRASSPESDAPLRAAEAIEAATTTPLNEGCRRERQIFEDCLTSDRPRGSDRGRRPRAFRNVAYVVDNFGAEIGSGPSPKKCRKKYQQRTNAEDETQRPVSPIAVETIDGATRSRMARAKFVWSAKKRLNASQKMAPKIQKRCSHSNFVARMLDGDLVAIYVSYETVQAGGSWYTTRRNGRNGRRSRSFSMRHLTLRIEHRRVVICIIGRHLGSVQARSLQGLAVLAFSQSP